MITPLIPIINRSLFKSLPAVKTTPITVIFCRLFQLRPYGHIYCLRVNGCFLDFSPVVHVNVK